MKKIKIMSGLVAFVIPMIASSVFAQDFTLRVADSFPTTHQYSKNTQDWLDLVVEKTNGRIAFKYFPAEQLAKSADLLDAAQNGLADIVYAPPLYLSDRLPLSTVTALPLVGNVTDQQALNDAFNELVLTDLNETEILPLGVRAIRSLVTAPYQVMSRGEKFDTVEQLQGVKLRSSGGVQERSVEALGAVPVAIPAPDLYPALQRGTVDGTLFNLPTAAGYKLQEQINYSTDNINLGLFPALYVINEDVWRSLPEDIQVAIIEAAREVIPAVVQADKDRISEFADGLIENGGGLYQIEDSQLEDWNTKLSGVRQAWVDSLEAQGKPAQAILDRWSALVTK
ncbi:Solute-binding protein [Sulfitobacter sp. DSM 110093]|uniref:TRAP transporter substrate-binding protein n=1 Tax=Sulfitobacter sp. DSM 110093 TaxID=2883127 RepID=UPI001FAD1B7D|nr:TRAP transporter substrate-binding protein DctP [Sulfitobacter sp. DSM 110093]UOA33115.1 Solute-binding protein [Sulfitobacter sp. DSM 110093]